MASSLRSSLHPGRSLSFPRWRRRLAPDLVLAPPRPPCAKPNDAIPGTVAAYVWLGASLALAACAIVFAVWLAISLPIEAVAPWSIGRAI